VQIAIGFLIAIVTTFLAPYVNYLVFGDGLRSRTGRTETNIRERLVPDTALARAIAKAIHTADLKTA